VPDVQRRKSRNHRVTPQKCSAGPSAGFARAILLLGGGRKEHAVRRATTVGRGTKSPSEA
jgi:hypothetical protein